MKNKHTICCYVNIAIFILIAMLVGCPSPSNDTKESTTLTKPALQSKSLIQKENTFTATFERAITIIDRSNIKVLKTPKESKKVVELTLDTHYTVEQDTDDTTKVKITLKTPPSLYQKYQVKFLMGAVQDTANKQLNGNLDTDIYIVRYIWSERYGHTTVVFDDKLWVLGGRMYTTNGSIEEKNDVWNSSDGKTWTEVTASASWSERHEHTTVVFKDKLWVLGGIDDDKYARDDVWNSSDGITWTVVTASADWSERDGNTTIVFNNKLWVMGGYTASDDIENDDVWNSSDGITWTKVTKKAKWPGRYGHTTVVFKDKLWVLGGDDGLNDKNDVWNSSDGITWTEVTASASWSERHEHTTVVFKDKLWVLGGRMYTTNGSIEEKNDVWNSSDGITWTEIISSTD